MAEKDELKPCPFCGSNNKMIYEGFKEEYEPFAWWWVSCDECGAAMTASTEKKVIQAWNRRANEH